MQHQAAAHLLDLQYAESAFSYLHSYFGDADLVGKEVVYPEGQPVWAMNYYGRLLDPSRPQGEEVGRNLKVSLPALYREGRFLGGWQHTTNAGIYVDTNEGDLTAFPGRKWIECDGVRAYELVYHGGLIR